MTTSTTARPSAFGRRPIPGPTGLPVLGSLLDFGRDQLAFVCQLRHDFGDVARYRRPARP